MRRTIDHYARKAKAEGYPARSVYKLQELNERYRIIQQGQCSEYYRCTDNRLLALSSESMSWCMSGRASSAGSGLQPGLVAAVLCKVCGTHWTGAGTGYRAATCSSGSEVCVPGYH